MKVFEIGYTPKPPGRFREYAGLCFKNKEDVSILRKLGQGHRFPDEWKPMEFYIQSRSLPRPDIFGVAGSFVIDERSLEILGEPLKMCAEILPVIITGDSKPYYLWHITKTINAVDRERSEWRPPLSKRSPRSLSRPSFFPERLGPESIFKIPEDYRVGNYCLERTNDPAGGEFKALVEHHKLTGLEFIEVWSE